MVPTPEKYTELRRLMRARGVNQHDIALWTDRSDACISDRFASSGWTVSEAYTIMDKLRVPHRKMHILFPPDGMWAGPLEDPPPTAEQELCAAIRKIVRETTRR